MNHPKIKSTGQSVVWPRLVALLALLVLFVCLNLRQTGTGEDEAVLQKQADSGGEIAQEKAERMPADEEDSDLTLPLAERISQLDAWIQNGQNVPSSPMRPIAAPPERNPELIPRHVPLDEKQDRALGALRMRVPGKKIEFRTSPDSRALTWLKGRVLEPRAEESDPGLSLDQTTARRFLSKNIAALALEDADSDLTFLRASKDSTQRTQLRYQQRYDGLSVWGREVLVQLDPTGNVELMVGAYVPSPDGVTTTAALSEDDAISLAREHIASPDGRVVEQELLVYAPDGGDESLAYRCSIHDTLVNHWDVFVDARDGEILHQSSRICTAHATGSGQDTLGQTRNLNLWRHTDGNYLMIDTTKSMYDPTSSPPNFNQMRGAIVVRDANNAGFENQFGPNIIEEQVTFSTSSNPNSGWTKHAVDGALNMGRVYDFFLQRFNRNSLDNKGLGLEALVNFPAANAWKPFEGGRMIFGNRGNYPAALDVVGHEMTHGVIFYTSNLKYENQSGALNESISDILGEACEAFHDPQKKSDWSLGTLLPADSRRSFIDPSQQGNPSKFGQFVVTTRDAGGVHINSSITNHCFYQLAEGLPGAIGFDKAVSIFFNGFTTKLVALSKFEHARRACIQAAEELFGAGSTEATKTAEAFDFVEIFDSSPINTSEIPEIAGNDNVGFLFQSNGQTFVGRRDESLGDPLSGVFLGNNGQATPALPGKRMSVSANGSLATYVTPDFDAGFVNTVSGERMTLGLAGKIESVAISADGNVVAIVIRDPQTGQPTNRLQVVNRTTGEEQVFEARQPVRDQSGSALIDTVQFVDTLELSPDGSQLYYDAVTNIYQAGIDGAVWSMYAIRVSNGEISELFPANPLFNVGNPSLAQTRPHLMTFDVSNTFSGLTEIWTYDLAAGTTQQVASLAGPASLGVGWPGYSGDDTAIVYTNYFFDQFFGSWIRYVESQPVQEDGRTRRGAPFSWLAGSGDFGPGLGVIYRRGTYNGFQEISVTAAQPAAGEGGNNGVFRITREGPTNTEMNFDFVLTGSAEHGTDFQTVSLSQTMAANVTTMDITINVLDDAISEAQENLTLTLSDNLHYQVAQRSASITIADNDVATTGFASWATQNGISADDFGGDADADGIDNGTEYAFGTNPKSKRSQPSITIRRSNGQVIVEALRTSKATDVNYDTEVSSSLAPGSWRAAGINATILEDSATRLRLRLNGATTNYIRLRITRK